MFVCYICRHIVVGLRQSFFVLKAKRPGVVRICCTPYEIVQSGRRPEEQSRYVVGPTRRSSQAEGSYLLVMFVMLCKGTLEDSLSFDLQFMFIVSGTSEDRRKANA